MHILITRSMLSMKTWHRIAHNLYLTLIIIIINYRKGTSNRQAPVFQHYGKAHGSLSSGWMNYNYTACCWFPTSSNILILPSQFWQIRFESCWLHCSKCRILVLLRYFYNTHNTLQGMSLCTVRKERLWRNTVQVHDVIEIIRTGKFSKQIWSVPLKESGRLFHKIGAAWAKRRSP